MPCVAYVQTFILTTLLYGKVNEMPPTSQKFLRFTYCLGENVLYSTQLCINDTYPSMAWLRVFPTLCNNCGILVCYALLVYFP
jgi:hypothetical protein